MQILGRALDRVPIFIEMSLYQWTNKHLTIERALFVCYAVRWPFFHLEKIFHAEKERSRLGKNGDLLFLASDLTATVSILRHLNMLKISLSKRFLLSECVTVLRGAAYFFYGLEAIQILAAKPKEGKNKDQARIDLLLSISQVAFATFNLIGTAVKPISIALTVITISLTCLSIGHKWIRN